MDSAVVAAIRRHIQTLETLPMGEFERGLIHGLRLSLLFSESGTSRESQTQPAADIISFQEASLRRLKRNTPSTTQRA